MCGSGSPAGCAPGRQYPAAMLRGQAAMLPAPHPPVVRTISQRGDLTRVISSDSSAMNVSDRDNPANPSTVSARTPRKADRDIMGNHRRPTPPAFSFPAPVRPIGLPRPGARGRSRSANMNHGNVARKTPLERHLTWPDTHTAADIPLLHRGCIVAKEPGSVADSANTVR